MNTPLQMAYNVIAAIVRRERNAQWYWANELTLDALARGARGPAQQISNEDLMEEARRAA